MGSDPVSASHPSVQSAMVVHESPQYIVVQDSPPPSPQLNPVGPIFPPPSPRQGAYIEHANGIPYLTRPSRGGDLGGGGGILLVGGRLHLLLRARRPRFARQEGPLVPPWPGGLLTEAVAGHLLLVGVEVPRFDVLGAPLRHGGRLTKVRNRFYQLIG